MLEKVDVTLVRYKIANIGRSSELIFFLSALIATRVVFRSRYLYDIDSVNFALGMRRFDPASHQPHPPGYFLYVFLGRLVNVFTGDANAALVAIGIAASCGALIAIYALADNWFGRRAAFFAGLIFLFSPLVWFHGTVALTYVVEAFFSALAGYLGWRVMCGSTGLVAPLALTVGVAAGFRPSFLLFLTPVLLFAVRNVGRKRILAGSGVLALTLLAWWIPMIWQSGGLTAWWSALLSLWRTVPGRQTLFNSSVANSIARAISIAGIYILCFGSATLLTFRPSRTGTGPDRLRQTFTWIWVIPGLIFFALIFLKFVNSGYLLVISPPVFAWLGLRASQFYIGLRFSKGTRIALVLLFAVANSLIFLYAPVYCSYFAVRQFEAELEGIIQSIPRISSPADTLIVGFDSHFLGYRHAGYYLPDYAVVQYPEVRLASGIRVFMMEQGDTHPVEKVPLGRFRNFVFFPLPSNDTEYKEYMLRLRQRFPKGALRTIVSGGREFVTGSVTDLPLLFPTTSDLSAVKDIRQTPVHGR